MTLLTDEQAHQQECPLMTYCVNEADVLQRRVPPIYVQRVCQGSGCKIGWRWVDDVEQMVRTRHGNPRRATEAQKQECVRDRRGYCGNFGRPAP